jgi:2,3-bisphosphoglycerate-independent phosphoglycerate mutase
MGMLSNGGVHSHIKHQFALLQAAADAGIGDRTYIHIFLDGRDTSPDDADSFVGQLEKYAKIVGAGIIETIVGRHYSMDRAQNWDRIEDAYNLLTQGKGKKFDNWKDAMRDAFASGDKRSYEIATPRITTGDVPFRPIASNDAVVFYNYRSDRARQLTAAFADPHFSEFKTQQLKNLVFVTMTSYDREVPTNVMFEDKEIKNTLGEVIADHNLTQLRIAESEKFAHVTYFFNGGREKPYKGETDVKIPSLKTKDFSKHPEMSAKEITDKVVHAIEKDAYDVIVMNYANPDMVAHTGKFKPTIQAVEVVDEQLGRVVEAALAKGGGVLITCDHGNAESCINQITHEVSTDHNNNPVPVIYVGPGNKQEQPKDEGTLKQILSTPIGFLADVAPTTLEILGIKKPKEMTAQSLLKSLV